MINTLDSRTEMIDYPPLTFSTIHPLVSFAIFRLATPILPSRWHRSTRPISSVPSGQQSSESLPLTAQSKEKP